ncbi:hypothetical protein HLB44_00530 [Aquincola sp. S2]|uniref:Uncharacterized protein n=1 Tax=Pseudaquabacterium terrae TaxID=2732868 RepID=A0ABX2EAN7_9BURK|nr:hypothetical protein [Aquabacterium terrae]NRF65459.1 hypothetical protein [Aquabacterium terrae]
MSSLRRSFEPAHPQSCGHSERSQVSKAEAMKNQAFLKVLPATSPGLTAAEIGERVLPHLPQALFPQGAKAGWWKKGVQLDLEAKGLITPEKTKPLCWHLLR